MKKFCVIVVLSLIGCNSNCGSACGYTATNNEVVGQVKRVEHNTPIVCSDFDSVDVSMGVMRGGVGSYSIADVWLTVTPEQAKQLKEMQRINAIVRFTYNKRRYAPCVATWIVSGIENVTDAGI